MRHLSISVYFFKIKLFICFDTLILKIYFFIIKIHNFRGDLSSISAKKSSLLPIATNDMTIKLQLEKDLWVPGDPAFTTPKTKYSWGKTIASLICVVGVLLFHICTVVTGNCNSTSTNVIHWSRPPVLSSSMGINSSRNALDAPNSTHCSCTAQHACGMTVSTTVGALIIEPL